jgi:hypothetical protein
MRRVVFYSWQSDLPNATNRGLIESALETAARAIAGDDTVNVEPVIDRDTEGIAGSPDIASTIFAKIDAAAIVVADVSIINNATEQRCAPNPNVLIEVGYALKALSFERVILVFNSAFGEIESLPFDLRMRRLVVYNAALDDKDRAAARGDLGRKLEKALRSALALIPALDNTQAQAPAVEAIENQRVNRRITVRTELVEILASLDKSEPKKFRDGGNATDYLNAITRTQSTVARFAELADVVAIMNDNTVAEQIYVWFGMVLERYALPRGFSGTFYEADFDFFKFVGHELFVSLFAFLLRERRWEIISKLLNEPIPVRYLRGENGPGNAEWSDICQYVGVLGGVSEERQRLSVHADILNERHSKGGVAAAMPFEDFADADFFLYLKGILGNDKFTGDMPWKPWSALYLKGAPRFLLRAQSANEAENIARVLAAPSVQEFKERLRQRGPQIRILYQRGFWEYPVREAEIQKIGSRKS